MDQIETVRTAIHEAGHAVVAVALGYEVGAIDFTTAGGQAWIRLDQESVDGMLVDLAGPAAEVTFGCHVAGAGAEFDELLDLAANVHQWGGGDFMHALETAVAHRTGPRRGERFLRSAWQAVLAFLARPAPKAAVGDLSLRMIANGLVDGDTVHEVLGSTSWKGI